MDKIDISTIIIIYSISLIFLLLSYFLFTDIFMIFPFIAVYVIYKRKYQNFKKWVLLGSIAIILMSLTVWAFLPMTYNEIHQDLSSINYVGNKTLVENFSYSINNNIYNIYIKSLKNIDYNISIVEYLKNGSEKYIVNISGNSHINGSYYYININYNISNLQKDIYLTNITLTNGTNRLNIYLFQPNLYSKIEYQNLLMEYAFNITFSIFLYILIFSEFIFVLIGFGIYMLLKGRRVIKDMTQNQEKSNPP
ncbi:MAG: hypothetical protein ACP5LM_01750 [Thermoplasmata archaeon]